MTTTRRLRRLLAVGLAAHGAIHTIGVVSAWGLAEIPELGGATLIATAAKPGDPSMVVLGLVWLGAMAMVFLSAFSTWQATSRWVEVVAAGATASLVPTVVWWSDAIFGVVLNVAVLVAVVAWRVKGAATLQPGFGGRT